MPLRLKTLELHGYKTFAARSTFEFPGMITAIVGPNGSGKSNIADGLRWVLGEQVYGLLRGKKTEDMIFSGSEGRPRAGMASATIHFDNSEGWLPIDYSEVAITRRAYRDGQNEYLLNGQRVRLRDISELLSQSGLSERTFTVIGQGMVDASLALRPEERRKLFEEAAGIGLYRSRREESLTRLENTNRNIERVKDIIAELEPRVSQLERQAKKAMEFERVKADLRMTLREWYGYHWYKSQQDLLHQRDSVRSQEKIVEADRLKHGTLATQVSQLRLQIQELRTKLNQWHGQASILHNEKEIVSREIAVIEERLRSLSDQLNNYHMDEVRLKQELESTRENIVGLEDEKETLELDLVESKKKTEQVKLRLDELREQKTRRERAVNELRRRINQLESTLIQYQTQVEEKTNRKKSIFISKDTIQKSIDESSSQVETLQIELEKSKIEKDQVDRDVKSIQVQITSFQREQNVLTSKLTSNRAKLGKLQGNLAQLKIEMDVIIQAEKNLTGYSAGAKQLLTLIRNGDLRGMEKALSSELLIPEEYEAAIAAALGDFVDSVIVSDEQDLEFALGALESVSNTRSAIFSKNSIGSQNKISIKDESIIGNAIDLIKFPPSYQSFLELLLNNVIVVRIRKDVKSVLKQLPDTGRVVTLNGELFYKNGAVIGGKLGPSARISRPRQLQDLQQQLKDIQTEVDSARKEIEKDEDAQQDIQENITNLEKKSAELQNHLRQVNQQYQQVSLQEEKAKRQLDWNYTQQLNLETEQKQVDHEISKSRVGIQDMNTEVKKLTDELSLINQEMDVEDIDTYQSEYNFQQTNIAVNQRALNDLLRRIREKQEFLSNTEKSLQNLSLKIDQIQQNMLKLEEEKEGKKSIEVLRSTDLSLLQEQILPAEAELTEFDEKYNQMLEIENNSQNTLANGEKYLTQAQMDFSYKKEAIETLRRRIEEDFGLVAFEYSEDQSGPTPLPFEGMVEELPHVEKLSPELEESLTRQKALIRRMGAVNPEAQAEYLSTKERHDFLKNQVVDLFKAEEDLKKILMDLDQLMKSEFQKTFQLVAEEFPRMFNRLFGGGSARLSLTDPDNIHDTGIEIHARLPGKREQELTLLSGGERSLTAVALIFALLKIAPTPFCVLDEVDAALDETNVGRFRELLEELSKDIQFILVTHNRNTVQAANVIYGITMGKNLTSQSISLRLDQVSEDMLARN